MDQGQTPQDPAFSPIPSGCRAICILTERHFENDSKSVGEEYWFVPPAALPVLEKWEREITMQIGNISLEELQKELAQAGAFLQDLSFKDPQGAEHTPHAKSLTTFYGNGKMLSEVTQNYDGGHLRYMSICAHNPFINGDDTLAGKIEYIVIDGLPMALDHLIEFSPEKMHAVGPGALSCWAQPCSPTGVLNQAGTAINRTSTTIRHIMQARCFHGYDGPGR